MPRAADLDIGDIHASRGKQAPCTPLARTPTNELPDPRLIVRRRGVPLTRIIERLAPIGVRHADGLPTGRAGLGVRCRVRSNDTRSMPGRCSSIRPGPQPGHAGAVGTTRGADRVLGSVPDHIAGRTLTWGHKSGGICVTGPSVTGLGS